MNKVNTQVLSFLAVLLFFIVSPVALFAEYPGECTFTIYEGSTYQQGPGQGRDSPTLDAQGYFSAPFPTPEDYVQTQWYNSVSIVHYWSEGGVWYARSAYHDVAYFYKEDFRTLYPSFCLKFAPLTVMTNGVLL